ncbi:heterokaryon incompatibility protein-domain-containing protein [Bombardia bombarda]|uniref:Heterokaryon incompatibility protein-domain-containing protein n=1 Tax=Bombardia bombarda TaxID=252184 RepID=A0AA39X8M0_9PEZI|nr:heterokaryon incompatibility protein-domain-containing protein [Bombardia bombarda]
MNRPPTYQYQPLKGSIEEIRLVHLLPGNLADPISFRIEHAPLSLPPTPPPKDNHNVELAEHLQGILPLAWSIQETDAGDLIAFNVTNGETRLLASKSEHHGQQLPEYEPKYDALSYTWGTAAVSEFAEIQVHPEQPIQALGIRPNLASALRHLRLPAGIRVLWIDAICINQDDMEERSEQVQRMADIYSRAHQVVAWLGNEGDGSQQAFATLRHVGNQLRSTTSGRTIAAPDATEPRLWRNDTPPSFSESDWQAITALVERQWFYRLWCWQEIKLGSRTGRLQCGQDSIPWAKFWLAITCLHAKDTTISRQFRERCRHIVFLRYEGESMSNILDIARSKGCADPRDKIYGLLGITPEYFKSEIVVNYLRPVGDVYKDAFLAHSRATQRLDLLKHCDLSGRSIGGPSWVPDWSKTEFASPILSEQWATGISRAWFTYRDEEPEMLEVVGTLYSTVKTVSSSAAPKQEEETLLVVKDWYQQLALDLGTTYPGGEDIKTAFILTLCMNRTNLRHPDVHFWPVLEWTYYLDEILQLGPESSNDPIYLERETANLIQKIRGRRFFMTEDGHFGTAPAGVEAGDAICLLLGTNAPILLRPRTPESPDTSLYQVVGECYIYGLSDAAGLLGPIPGPWHPIITGDNLGRARQWFFNLATGERTIDDPRLAPLPHDNWDRALYERQLGDPTIFERFVNLGTGEMANHDPRMSVEALEGRYEYS